MINNIKKLWKLTVDKTIEEKNSLDLCKKEIQDNNALILQTMLFAVSLILAVNFWQYLSLAISTGEKLNILGVIYLGAMILAMIMFTYIRFISRKYVLQAIYIVYTLAFVYSFMIGVSVPDNVTVTFLLVLFMVSTLYIDKGMRIHFFMTIAVVFYVNAIAPYKNPIVLQSEIENAYTVLFLLFIIGTIARNSRLDAFVAQNRLHKYAYIDQLTNVNNRRKLFEDFAKLENMESSKRVTAISLLDIDNFKLYNDTYGHGLGDEVLKKIGETFNKLQEKGEIVCYRYGGEEFAIKFIDLNEKQIYEYANKVLEEVRKLNIEHKTSSHKIVTISVGVALMLEDCEPKFEYALNIADKALYKAKEKGRNKIEILNACEENELMEYNKVRQR